MLMPSKLMDPALRKEKLDPIKGYLRSQDPEFK